jgi:hypothetical protein
MLQPSRPKIPVGTPLDITKPITGKFSFSEKWSFSFEYFKQIEYFGLGETNTKWFVSFLEKLKELSNANPQEFEKNQRLRNANRYHKINWSAKNIPYSRTDFTWISEDIIKNEEEFPFFQFQISQALGRIIGFWDLNNRSFQIVLLDSKHNMQPSKKYSYSVDDTTELCCEMTSLLIDIESIKKVKCKNDNCEVKSSLHTLPSKLNRGNFVYMMLEDDYYASLEEKLKTHSIREIIELGLLSE